MAAVSTAARRLRRFHHSDFPADRPAGWTATVSVCVPARNEAANIVATVEHLVRLRQAGIVHQVLVLDDSSDGTAELAAAAGAEVHDQSSLRAEFGPVDGKGDALWRSLQLCTGDVVCYLDADSADFGERFPRGLIGAVASGRADFAKGSYRRPFRSGGVTQPTGGGRVTELTARPLLELFYPELAQFGQPLAGEMAARRELLERLPFACGYSVDIALLIDAWHEVGLDRMAEVDLDVRQNRHRPLHELGPMATQVAAGILSRVAREGRLDQMPPLAERPPAASLRRRPAAA
jgi:glucosyl-3-phosphoglycerate synthase